MGVFVDPESGEEFDVEETDQGLTDAIKFGLVPQAQYQKDQEYEDSSFADKALDTGQAFLRGATRPLEALRDTLVDVGIAPKISDPYMPEGALDKYSPSKAPGAREQAERHPIAAAAGGAIPEALAIAATGGAGAPAVLGGIAGSGLIGAGEAAFQRGGEYSAMTAGDVAKFGAIGAATVAIPGAAALAGRAVTAGTKLGVAGLESAAQAAGRGIAAKAGRFVSEVVVEEAVETGFKAGGAAVGSAVGGIPGAVGGWLAGRALNKRFGERATKAILEGMGPAPGMAAGAVGGRVAAQAVKPISAEAVALGTGFGSIFSRVSRMASPETTTSLVAAGNVLARASHNAKESVQYADLGELDDADRAQMIRDNGGRYMAESTTAATDALERQTLATVKARESAASKIPDLVLEASDRQRDEAQRAVMALDKAEAAFGKGDVADRLGEIGDRLMDVVTSPQADHDPGKTLSALSEAYETLSANGEALPPEAAEAMAVLREVTEKPEVWGDAAQMLAELRSSADAADMTDISTQTDPDSWRQALGEYSAQMRKQVDAFQRWGIDAEDIDETLDKLDEAVEQGNALQAEMLAARVSQTDDMGSDADDFDADDPTRGALSAALSEAGVAAQPGQFMGTLPGDTFRAVRQAQKFHHYDKTIRAVQTGAEVAAVRAARGAAGVGRNEVDTTDETNQRFEEGYSDEFAAFEGRRAMLERLQEDPSAIGQSLSRSYGELATTHPEVFAGLTEFAGRATAILNESMPASIEVSMKHPGGIPPSMGDVRAWSRLYMTIVEPDTFLKDLGSGQAWPDQVAVFSKMYPEAWQGMTAIAEQTAEERGPDLSPQEATYLDLTFGIGAKIGGLWSDSLSGSIRRANAARRAAAEQKGKSQGPPRPGMMGPQSATAALTMAPSASPVV